MNNNSARVNDLDLNIYENDEFNMDCMKDIIFTDSYWDDEESKCPVCKNSPLQLLFDKSISKFIVCECMLCKQKVAYSRRTISRKNKNHRSNFNSNNKDMETLNFMKFGKKCFKKKRKKNRVNEHQLHLDFEF